MPPSCKSWPRHSVAASPQTARYFWKILKPPAGTWRCPRKPFPYDISWVGCSEREAQRSKAMVYEIWRNKNTTGPYFSSFFPTCSWPAPKIFKYIMSNDLTLLLPGFSQLEESKGIYIISYFPFTFRTALILLHSLAGIPGAILVLFVFGLRRKLLVGVLTTCGVRPEYGEQTGTADSLS